MGTCKTKSCIFLFPRSWLVASAPWLELPPVMVVPEAGVSGCDPVKFKDFWIADPGSRGDCSCCCCCCNCWICCSCCCCCIRCCCCCWLGSCGCCTNWAICCWVRAMDFWCSCDEASCCVKNDCCCLCCCCRWNEGEPGEGNDGCKCFSHCCCCWERLVCTSADCPFWVNPDTCGLSAAADGVLGKLWPGSFCQTSQVFYR